MKNIKNFLIILIIILLLLIIAFAILILYPHFKTYYTAEDFGITIVKSSVDYNNNGIDDYTDILLGAKQETKNHPTYRSAYYSGGYPPDEEGVCTDMIWRALKNAGYNLKDMIDEDIANNVEAYPRVSGKPDPNIDFRRVPNLKVFFERNALTLTTDLSQISEWQPGDIVAFENSHIGIISDKRNKDGIPYLIHNAGQPFREEDVLEIWNKLSPISGHYRLELK